MEKAHNERRLDPNSDENHRMDSIDRARHRTLQFIWSHHIITCEIIDFNVLEPKSASKRVILAFLEESHFFFGERRASRPIRFLAELGILRTPNLNALEHRFEFSANVAELVFHLGRHLRILRSEHQTLRFELLELDGERCMRHLWHAPLQLVEAELSAVEMVHD